MGSILQSIKKIRNGISKKGEFQIIQDPPPPLGGYVLGSKHFSGATAAATGPNHSIPGNDVGLGDPRRGSARDQAGLRLCAPLSLCADGPGGGARTGWRRKR